MRFFVVLALVMIFTAPATEADASAHKIGDMALSQSVDCQTSDCCGVVRKSDQSGNHDNSDSNQCGSEFNCGSCSSLSGEIALKDRLPVDSITRFVPDYSRLLTSSHLINLERPPKFLS